MNAIIGETPSLLWAQVWPVCEAFARGLDEPHLELGIRVLAGLRLMAAEFERTPNYWLAVSGPLQTIAAKVIAGECTLGHGLQQVQRSCVVGSLCPAYVEMVAEYQVLLAFKKGRVADAVISIRLLLAAIDAIPVEADRSAMSARVVPHWLEVVRLALSLTPDRQIFDDAVRRGEALVLAQQRAGELEGAALNLNRLGTLHLDGYCLGRDPGTIAVELRLWLQRGIDTPGHDANMPSLLEAMTSAVGYFERALPYRRGVERGLTIKAYAQALDMRRHAGGPEPGPGLFELAQEGLALLSPEAWPNEVTYLKGIGAGGDLGEPEAPGEATYWLETDPWREVEEFGLGDAIGRYLTAGHSLVRADPEAAIKVLRRVWPLAREPGQESHKRSCVALVCEALRTQYAGVLSQYTSRGALPALIGSLQSQAQENGWPLSKLASVLMAAAYESSRFDAEEEGVTVTDLAIQLCEATDAVAAQMCEVARADLWTGAGVNHYRLGRWDEASTAYAAAAMRYKRAAMFDSCLECLQRMADVTFREPPRSAWLLVATLADCATAICLEGAQRVDERVQKLWERAILRLVEEQPEVLQIVPALLAAKGGAFAAAIAGRGRYDWRSDEVATGMLARIQELRAAGDVEPILDNSELQECYMMGFTEDLTVSRRDETALETLQRRFDFHVRRKQSSAGLGFQELDEIAARVCKPGDRTVFVSQMVCIGVAGGQPGRVTFLSTDEETDLVVGLERFFDRRQMVADGVVANSTGVAVARARAAILEDPGPASVSSVAAECLESDFYKLFCGDLEAQLRSWWQEGKRHLCIHAHGPYHYYPQHLLGPRGRPLADDWIVTYVPHPIVMGPTGELPSSRHELVVFGLDFLDRGNEGFPSMPCAVSEAEAVAAAFGRVSYCNSAATKSRFFDALATTRRMHVSTHGEQLSWAPVFQRLYLHPDETSDGVVYAYELLGRDLRHVDLITLSACETSPGRFDVADNLRGLVAALFASGVRTVVATLWPVLESAAAVFFVSFYERLSAGSDKLDAFRGAQIATREAFPTYRDWGAFQYLGGW